MADRSGLRCVIRRESKGDRDAIRSLTARAFSGLSFSDGTEPAVIDALRETHALALSLVAVLDERIVGHVAFSEVGPRRSTGGSRSVPCRSTPNFSDAASAARSFRQVFKRYASRAPRIVCSSATTGTITASASSSRRNSRRRSTRRSIFQLVRFGQAYPKAPVAFHPGLAAKRSTHAIVIHGLSAS